MLPRLLLGSLLSLLLFGHPAQAAPGDTTRVAVFNALRLTHYGAYDSIAPLPQGGGPYRKVLMHYVLSRYQCPGGTQYCGSWDYTTRVVLYPTVGDTLELGRVITPYATDWLQPGQPTRSHDYVLDVTDYANQLSQGPQKIRYFYDGYSWGFTVTLYFEFIEGTPAHDVVDVRRVYDGAFAFGRTSDPIENHLVPRTFSVPGGPVIEQVKLKTTVSGHGSDDDYCSEFCTKYYEVYANNQLIETTDIWRDDCGRNPVSPQTGTWVYDRGNWCPGLPVVPRYHDLTAQAAPGANLTVNIDMEPYTASNQNNAQAAYIWQAQLLLYGAPNFPGADADLREIISPTTDPNYARDNPACAGAKVRLRNGGAAPLTSLTFHYRANGGSWQTYAWTGSLAFLEETVVSLPFASNTFDTRTLGRFEVATEQPNGLVDPNRWNDTLRSTYPATVLLPEAFRIEFRTNSAGGIGGNETSWQLYDETGTMRYQRTHCTNNTTFLDTIQLAPGCYNFKVIDTGCDGLAWWANPGAGSGSLRFRRLNSNQSLRVINGDFGCETTLRFRVEAPTGLPPTGEDLALLDVYPNPAEGGRFTLDFALPQMQDVAVRVYSLDGRLVHRTALSHVATGPRALDLHALARGSYLLECVGTQGTRAWRRIVINN